MHDFLLSRCWCNLISVEWNFWCHAKLFLFLFSDEISKCDIVTAETVEQLINEIGKIKTQMNSTELQLYEANEKIAELIENVGESGIYEKKKKEIEIVGWVGNIWMKNSRIELQHQHLKEENESLKVENSNLTKVAKLMTNSMKESMDTSKR